MGTLLTLALKHKIVQFKIRLGVIVNHIFATQLINLYEDKGVVNN